MGRSENEMRCRKNDVRHNLNSDAYNLNYMARSFRGMPLSFYRVCKARGYGLLEIDLRRMKEIANFECSKQNLLPPGSIAY